jgi:hypothetical protein
VNKLGGKKKKKRKEKKNKLVAQRAPNAQLSQHEGLTASSCLGPSPGKNGLEERDARYIASFT